MYIVNYENKLLDNLKKAKVVAVDTETISLDDKTMVGFSFAYGDAVHNSFYVPVRDKHLDNMPEHRALHLLNFIFKNCTVVFHNSSFDIPVLTSYGVTIPDKEFEDTVVMSNLVNEDMPLSLKKLAKEYFHYDMTKLKELLGTGKKRIDFHELDSEAKVEYACDDARYTLKLYYYLLEQLNKDLDSFKVYAAIEKPLLNVVADMHINGIPIDVDQVFHVASICRDKVDRAEEKLKILMGEDINFNSSKQLREFFIDKENMPIIKKSDKTGVPSVDKEVLEKYAEINGTAKLLLEHRKYNKILTTFIPALTPTNWQVDKETGKRRGRIFASFNQSGTVSGRFSSSRPNMQNIPRDKESDDPEYLGIRECFIPEKGHVFIGADYSQIELRVLAHFSQDPNLKYAYINKKDIHQQTANALGIDRQDAKTINFGLVYGMGYKTLAKQIKVPEDVAQEYIDKYFNTYRLVKEFWKNSERQFRTIGFVQTISGRKRRRSRHFYHKDDYEQGAEVRSASNAVIQGSAADLIKLSMISMHRRLKEFGAKLILTVHDEVLVSCPIEYAQSCYTIIKSSMEEAGKELSVPVEVDIKYGRTWAEAHSGVGGSLKDILGTANSQKELSVLQDRATRRQQESKNKYK